MIFISSVLERVLLTSRCESEELPSVGMVNIPPYIACLWIFSISTGAGIC